jgi:hypothetical protein
LKYLFALIVMAVVITSLSATVGFADERQDGLEKFMKDSFGQTSLIEHTRHYSLESFTKENKVVVTDDYTWEVFDRTARGFKLRNRRSVKDLGDLKMQLRAELNRKVNVRPGAAVSNDIVRAIDKIEAPAHDCLAAHNTVRRTHRLDVLHLDGKLAKAAQKHATWMASRGRLSHLGPRGKTWFARATEAGYEATYLNCSENIASGPAEHMDAETATDCWMNSKVGHRDNVLGKWRHVGFGMATSRGKTYWCALYANPKSVVRSVCPCGLDCKCVECNCH